MFILPSGSHDLNVARKDDWLDSFIETAKIVDVCIDNPNFSDPSSPAFASYLEAIILGSCCDPGGLPTFRRQVLLCRNKDVYRKIIGSCTDEARELLERFEYQSFYRLPDRKDHNLFLMLVDESQAQVDRPVISWVRYMASDNTNSRLVIVHPECPVRTHSVLRGLSELFVDCDDYVTVTSRSDRCRHVAQAFTQRSLLISGGAQASSRHGR